MTEYIEALEHLAKRAGINLLIDSRPNTNQPKIDKNRYYEMNKEAAIFFREMLNHPTEGKAAREYIENRQLSSATVKRFGLGYAPDSFDKLRDRLRSKGYKDSEMIEGYLCLKSQKGSTFDFFRDRLMFPVIDTTGNIIAFGGRMIHPAPEGDAGRKYMNSSDTPVYSKRKNLFALNFAKNYSQECLILCEGYMDVIALHQAGFQNAVATLGTAITPEQARLMSRYTKKVIISYDSDSAGQTAANKAIKLLDEAGIEASVLKMSGAKDPDEYIKLYGAASFTNLLSSSRSPFRFKVDAILSKYNMAQVEQKIKAVGEISSILADIPQKTQRELYIRQISDELELKSENVEADVQRIIMARKKQAKSDASRDIIRQTAGYTDRVNPDFAKNVGAAKAEEHLLALLLLYSEFRAKATRELELHEDDFLTDFGRRVYKKIYELEDSGCFDESLMGEDFTVDEMSRIKKIQLDRNGLNNSIEVLADCIKTLKTEKSTHSSECTSAIEDDILSIIKRKKQKQEN